MKTNVRFQGLYGKPPIPKRHVRFVRLKLRTGFKMNMALLPLLAVPLYCLRRGA